MSKLTYQQRSNQSTRIPVGQRRTVGGKVLEDNRAAFAAKQLKQDETTQRAKEEDERLKGKSAAQLAKKDEEETAQAKFSDQAPPVQLEEKASKPNNTGLPDKLKNGIESLSGLSMDNVKVHYNSAKPSQLNALAYAQGTDIHVAPGQEKHLPHEAWHVVQQSQGRVKPTMQMKGKVNINDDATLEKDADVMGAKALQMTSKQQIREVAKTEGPALTQLYTEHEGNIKVSEDNKFAVKNEGKPESELFASEGILFPELEGVSFTVGQQSEIKGMNKIEKKLNYSEEQIKNYHCGDFSAKITGTRENVENENAPVGRSLFVDNLTWGIDPIKQTQRGNWGNHYAAVIIEDGNDRGTFETAAGVDHAWFGIYGQKKGQTFRLKTVISDINLAKEKELIAPETAKEFLDAIKNYIENGSTQHEDAYLQKELNKIESIVGQTPDIDKKFKEEEKKNKQQEEELNGYWNFISKNSVDAIMEHFEQENPSTLRFFIFPKMEERAKRENDNEILLKINECQKRLTNKDVTNKNDGLSTTTKAGIGVGVIITGLLIWFLSRKK